MRNEVKSAEYAGAPDPSPKGGGMCVGGRGGRTLTTTTMLLAILVSCGGGDSAPAQESEGEEAEAEGEAEAESEAEGEEGEAESEAESESEAECEREDCDDEVDCTDDAWDAKECECAHLPNHALCFLEKEGSVCDPEDGCTVPKTVCSEDDDCPALLGGCLIGTCDLRVATCFYNALDRDGDGHPVQTCEKIGGDDCHDTDPEIYPGASEICDGEDNDCNSETDDILPQTCGSEVGECQTGTRACEDGEWSSSCVGEIAPRAETCDERDNDCDGEVDEGLLNRCGTCGPIPVEVCDGEDNDCDGSVDEGLLNACGECGPVPTEFCDGEDNDCDGRVDEDFGVYDSRTGRARGLGYSCGVGYGECLNIGEVICSADGSSAHCSVNPLPNESPEVCDRRDNDCDGEVDEDASPEVCDGLDNDCDGWPDESIFDPFPVCCGNGSCEPGDCGVLDCHWCPEECSPTACIEAMDGCEAESESEAEPESGAE